MKNATWREEKTARPANIKRPLMLSIIIAGGLYLFHNHYPLKYPNFGLDIDYRGRGLTLDKWLQRESVLAIERILKNIGPGIGAAEGVVIASPSKGEISDEPDYFYTWTRDSALTISTLLHPFLFFNATKDDDAPNLTRNDVLYESLLRLYIGSQARIQFVSNPLGGLHDGGLNEPKFGVDERAFTGNWGRPQRDGPALRALALIPYANLLLDRNLPLDEEYVDQHLFSPKYMRYQGMVIKNDLEEIAHGWWKGGFDLWEEIDGHHLFTLAMCMRALQAGSNLAQRLKDTGAAEFYQSQSEDIARSLESFWDEKKGYWLSSLSYEDLDVYPSSNLPALEIVALKGSLPEREWLDCSLPLTIIHAQRTNLPHYESSKPEPWSSPTDPTVLATLYQYILSFEGMYNINKGRKWTRGWALGRYKEDVYDGFGKSQGNPWYICTLSIAQTFYMAQKGFTEQGRIEIGNLTRPFWNDILSSNSHTHSHLKRKDDSEIQHDNVWYRGSKKFKKAIEGLGTIGDNFLRVGRRYTEGEEGRMSEQIGRNDGSPTGARDLTWSYASLVDVARARARSK